MAEEEVVILEAAPQSEESLTLIEDENVLEEEATQKEEDQKNEQSRQKKKKLLLIGGLTLLFLLLSVTIFYIFKPSPPSPTEEITFVPKEKPQAPKPTFSTSKLETMIKKANVLYEQGNKDEALKLYETIATFNESISFYNMGVAKMREPNFSEALDAFKKAIQNKEHRCISAINAAVCALELGDKALFQYYIDLAFAYLPEEANAPLYSYYVALVNYYKNFYYEALSALKNPGSSFYKDQQNYIASKILTSLSHTPYANTLLSSVAQEDDAFTRGLLSAKLGEYETAKTHLSRALKRDEANLDIKLSLALVENKLGNLANSASLLNDLYQVIGNDVKAHYRIQAMLKPSLFDVQKAQGEFEKELFFNTENSYSILFYYAPYKVFDAKQTIDYIRKGSMNIFIDEIGPALSYLKASSTISKVNIAISKGIKKALDFHVYEANEIFEAMVKEYKNHSILHYNLALTQAQIGDYPEAYRNFAKSYHLDSNNYLAGVFAIMSGKLIGKDIKKLSEDVKESITKNSTLEADNFYISLLYLVEGDDAALARWIEYIHKEETPLSLMLDTIAAKKLSNETRFRLSSQKLQALLPKDIIANMIAFTVKHFDKGIKEYAKAIQMEFNTLNLDYDAFYYGPKIVKEQYVKLLQVAGLVYQKRDSVRKRMEEERVDVASIMHTLAYLEIYANQFEEAFALYNTLIDAYHKKDAYTLFLASVAAIGAGHSENAIALFELAKLSDPNNLESRYALGLVYQEVGNLEAAMTQYRAIGNSGFISEYFTFNIVR